MTVAPVAAGAAAPSTGGAEMQRRSFAAALEARSPARPSASAAIAPHPAVAALSAIDRAQARIDAVLAAARAGRTFTAAELIGLQAAAYRCAQTVDLASKLAEQGAQCVKQALNAQV